jgi:hypothetical protein
MIMGFPTNPTDGDIRILGSRQWQYSESAVAWNRIPDPEATAAEAIAGTEDDVRLWSPLRIAGAIGALECVKQVVSDSESGAVSTTASAGLATGLSCVITLSKATNRVLLIAAHGGVKSAVAASNVKLSLLRGTDVVAVLANAIGSIGVNTSNMHAVIDSPGAVGPHTYTTKIFAIDNTNAASINNDSNISTLFAIEIEAAA